MARSRAAASHGFARLFAAAAMARLLLSEDRPSAARRVGDDRRKGERAMVSTRIAPHFAGAALALAMIALGRAVAPAHADLYSLEGRFRCLDDAAAICGDTTEMPATKERKETARAAQDAPPLLPEPQPQPAPVLLAPLGAAPHDPIAEIATHIEAGHPSPQELARLHTLANTGNGRAIELLAWCDYAGVGVPRDPIAAYILYGVAASAGVAQASRNQAVIYEYVLTPDQRQLVLDIANQTLADDGARSDPH
jgi:hypothetical protein